MRLRLALDVVGLLALVGFFGLVAWHGLGVVEQSWVSGSRSQSALETPTVIPQLVWILGLAAFIVAGAVLLGHALVLAARGDVNGTARLISTRSAEEEVEDEIRDLRERHARDAGGR
jgi:TRAP-type mannitol/chloroaromatic compound transport system permease small subunit